ncbi:hypothetical protein AAE478_001307 [Parahypoxylon ruwenzoriense]
MEMDTLGRRPGLERGTKRKYAGDGPETRGPEGTTTPYTNRRAQPPTVARNQISNANSTFNPAGSKDDEYYKTLYAKEPDFGLLGQRDPEFKAMLRHGVHLDFADPAAVMQLTKTLLRLDFGLHVDLPSDRLCPPVPNRHNYILWLKDLLDSSVPLHHPGAREHEATRQVTGLDIGTGASLIYPLLGCVQRPSWSFIATDVDAKSLGYAHRNLDRNNLQSRIRIVGRTAADCLIPLDDLGLGTIDFVMVNPPFYTSKAELADLASRKSRPPNSACTGAPVEMVCAGGEVGFVRRIIDESLVLRQRVQWYTSMLGKLSSLEVLLGALKDHGVTNYAVATFVQGNKTRRWAVGWSFGNRRPSLSASRGSDPSVGKNLLPPPTEATVATWPISSIGLQQLGQAIRDAMQALDLLSWAWNGPSSQGVGFVNNNVWGRAYRRKKARDISSTHLTGADAVGDSRSPLQPKQPEQESERDIAQCTFGFSVAIQVSRDAGDGEGKAQVVARWLQGNDYVLFESFTGFLRKSMHAACLDPDGMGSIT